MRFETDVLVVGAGTGGVTAALAAAAQGARVMLAERDGAVGGAATRSAVHSYYRGSRGGVQEEIDRRTGQIQQLLGGEVVGFHPEAKRMAMTEMLTEAGVEILYHALAVDVILEGRRVSGVIFETPGSTVEVKAKVTVDATGDGDICILAGVPYTKGRDWDGIMHAYSLVPRYIHPQTGKLAFGNFDAGWVDATSSWDISRSYIHSRALLWPDHPRWQNRRPPWADALLASAPLIGLREGPYIHGDYTLTLEDMIFDRRFPDVAMRCYSHYDTHALDMANESLTGQIWSEVLGQWLLDVGCDVPYRSFLPKGVDGLLIGCRALSQDHDAGQALRMQRDILKVGEVAGTAAGLACQQQCQPRQLDIKKLQRALIARGVLAAEDLSRKSRPWVLPPGVQRDGETWEVCSKRTPEELAQLVAALGTKEEGRALWWLWQSGEDSIPPLLDVLKSEAPETQKRGAAIGLALLGEDAGVPWLVKAIERRDDDRLALDGVVVRGGTSERWIASLICLKFLGHTAAVGLLADSLPKEQVVPNMLHILHYFAAVADRLDADEKTLVCDSVRKLLARNDIGQGYAIPQTVRWSVDLIAAYTLVLCGDREAIGIAEEHLKSPWSFIREAATRVVDRCQAALAS